MVQFWHRASRSKPTILMENISIQDAEGRVFCKISFYKDVLHVHWQGTIDDTMIKRACNEVVRAVDDTRCWKMISNQKDIAYCTSIEDWARTIWLPNLKYMGLQYLAMVHSSNILSQQPHLTQNDESVINDIIIQHFCEEEDAKQWFNMLEHVLVD